MSANQRESAEISATQRDPRRVSDHPGRKFYLKCLRNDQYYSIDFLLGRTDPTVCSTVRCSCFELLAQSTRFFYSFSDRSEPLNGLSTVKQGSMFFERFPGLERGNEREPARINANQGGFWITPDESFT